MLRIRLAKRRIVLVTAILAIVVPITTYATLRAASNSTVDPSPGLEVELTTLRPAGFEPLEITRPKDPFVLFIDDRSGKETSLVLQRVKGERLRTINLNRKKSEWQDVLDLSPGTYVLQDPSNPESRCQITILP